MSSALIRNLRPMAVYLGALVLLLFSGCEAPLAVQTRQDREALSAAITGEKPGDYYIGRRFYKVDYKMWGWVRKPGQPWKESQLVMFNEQKMLAPDRARHAIGSDNNREYRLVGTFSGQKVYEPASDSFYPEFVLKGATVLSTNPPLIFPDARWIDPTIRLLAPPQF
jgi:hypothetical protein